MSREGSGEPFGVGVLLLALAAAPRPGAAQVPPGLRLERLATAPAGIGGLTADPRGGDDLYVVLLDGRVLVWNGTRLVAQPFLDIRSLVSTGGERGLFSLAFHPRFADNGFFFVNYTNRDGDTEIVRYRVSADPARADPGSARLLLRIGQPFANHNGGQLQFGPDRFLYVGMGDGGSGGDPLCNGQDDDTLLGKMLRLDVDATGSGPTGAYGIPASNPFRGPGGPFDEVWSEGWRNPWRFSFDRQTGDLYVADVGQSSREEVDFQPAASPGGENYGWNVMEGTLCSANPCANAPPCNDPRLTRPILEYGRNLGCAVTGGYVYRGSRLPELAGAYLFGDFCAGTVWAGRRSGQSWRMDTLPVAAGGLTTFGEDAAGDIYLGTTGGDLLALVGDEPAGPGAADRLGIHLPSRRRFALATDDGATAFTRFRFGPTGAVGLAGDWDGDGEDGVGAYTPASGQFQLRDAASAGAADLAFRFGQAGRGWLPVAGDWNGDGIDTVGVYDPRNGVFRLSDGRTGRGPVRRFDFAGAGGAWLPIAGDWDGDGRDGVGLYEPATGAFFLKNTNADGGADVTFDPGGHLGLPLAGDWDGDGQDGVGVYDPASGATDLFELSLPEPERHVDLPAGGRPLAGCWGG
jgi:glucose/arabinose dehydrogenase